MKFSTVCKKYFSGFQDLLDFKKNNIQKNVLATFTVLSYFTVIIPLFFAITYSIDSLHGRVSKKNTLTPSDKKTNATAQSLINPLLEAKIKKVKDDQIICLGTAVVARLMAYLINDHKKNNSKSDTFNIKFDEDSLLMKRLLSPCRYFIRNSFNEPKKFAADGIVFEFLKQDKLGLLDELLKEGKLGPLEKKARKELKQKIIDKLDTISALSIVLKASVTESDSLSIEIQIHLNGGLSEFQKVDFEDLIKNTQNGLTF